MAFKALGPVDLDVLPHEFLSLVGPSGCGKSTALRVIAGLLAPSAGMVSFPSGKPETAFVFQEPTLMPWASALDNARLPLDLKGVARAEANARAGARSNASASAVSRNPSRANFPAA
jgi:NitT/TauT family transport system ATP-binding protein